MEGSVCVRKGAWSEVEDDLLRACVRQYGEGKWHLVPTRAGLNRCRKSCRQRWLNYLKPDIKRGEFAEDEVDIMLRLHKLLGNRWSLIAGRLPGRTPNDVKNYWNTYIRRRACSHKVVSNEKVKTQEVIKPRAKTISRPSPWLSNTDPTTSPIPDISSPIANNTFDPNDTKTSTLKRLVRKPSKLNDYIT